METHFELLAELVPEYCPSVHIYKWKSRRTGMQVVLINRKSPSVQGYFTVATEANDDSGCPHTLEHIVFMGSKKFPYKGLLDKLSAKQLSSTNAWTAQDQTCYTMTTAGYEGFFNLLPVYLDHILNASVDDAACTTEVYHIDGKGEEKGVVFSEMQGYEHISDSLMAVAAQKMLFNPQSGYATNTGGNLNALRSLKPHQIKSYHQQVYCPHNLSVIISGDVTPETVLNSVLEFDNSLDEVPERSTRPFLDSKFSQSESPLTKTEIKEIQFPDSSEVSGEILISWLGPEVQDFVKTTAVEVLNSYLTMRGAGKLQLEFVDAPEDQAIASEVYMYSNEFLKTQVNLSLYGVPVEDLKDAGPRILKFLESDLLSNLDMPFISQCVDRVFDTFLMSAEEDWITFVELAITEFIYGDDKTSSFNEWLGTTIEFDILRKWTEDDWKQFIKSYIVDPPKACVIGVPSCSEYSRIEEEKKANAEKIQTTVDLKQAEANLERAIAVNEKEIPNEMLNMFPKPDFNLIHFIDSQTAATPKLIENLPGAQLKINESLQQLVETSGNIPNLAIDFESVSSQFVTTKIYMRPDAVPAKNLCLVDVILSQIFAFPMTLQEDGEDGEEKRLTGEEVAQAVKRDLVVSHFTVDYQLQEMVTVEFKAKASKYNEMLKWIQRLIFNVEFDEEHVKMFLAKHLKSVAETKRFDTSLLASSMDSILLTNKSLRRQADVLISEPEILYFQEHIDEAVQALEQMSSQLFRTDNMRILVIGDIPQLAKSYDLMKPWQTLAKKLDLQEDVGGKNNQLTPIPKSSNFLSELGEKPSKKCFLTLCAASDSSHISVVGQGPAEYGHKDLPALTLVNGLLQMTEGPLWNAVRGPGYAYGVFLDTSVQLGKVCLKINSASDPLNALNASRDVVMSVLDNISQFDREEMYSAICTIVSELAAYLGEQIVAVNEKFLDTVMKGYEPNYVYQVIKDIQSVTVADFKNALERYIVPLFNSETSLVFAVAPPLERENLVTAFEKLDYDVEVVEVEIECCSDDESESDSESQSQSQGSDESGSEESD